MINGVIRLINGIEVYPSKMIPEFMDKTVFVFPRSKKKRIRKKYAKDPRNIRRERHLLMAMGKVFIHPNNLDMIKGKIDAG